MNELQLLGIGIAIGALVMFLVVIICTNHNEKKRKEYGDH